MLNKITTHVRVTKVYSDNEGMLHFRGQNIRKALPYADKSHIYFIEVKLPAVQCNTIPAKGQVWEITGSPVREDVVENGYKKQRYTFIEPTKAQMILSLTGEEIKHFIGKNKDFKGIGQATATKLFNEFGESLFDMLKSNDLTPIEQHREFSKHVPALINGWARYENLKYASFFMKLQIPHAVQQALFGAHSGFVVESIKENPYLLQTLGMEFDVVDKIALEKFQMALDDPRRSLALVEGAVKHFTKYGHTYATLEQIYDHLGGDKTAMDALTTGAKGLGIYYCLETDTVHSVPHYIMEETVARRILTLTNTHIPLSGKEDYALKHELAQLPFQLEEQQLTAVIKSLSNAYSCIVGGAGTGKTTVLRLITSVHLSLGYQVFGMALSGRAAMKLQESINYPTKTIAGFLNNLDLIDEQEPMLIVIDEASMVDIGQLYQIVTSVPTTAKLLIVGDDGQIPPIGAGLVLSELIEVLPYYTTTLDVVKRQDETTGIPEYSQAIRAKQLPESLSYKAISFQTVSKNDMPLFCLKAMGNDVQVICATRKMAQMINITVQEGVNPNPFLMWQKKKTHFKIDDPVIFTKNDSDLGVQNGLLGRIVGFDGESECVYVRKDTHSSDDNNSVVALEHFYDLELAYAITLHKAQGSQFHTVIVAVENNSMLVDNSWIYTATTRAVEKLIIIGTEKAFREAIVRPSSAEKRQVYLSELIERLSEAEANID
ncbi:TPA: AAA family ATPase [Vibrio diabolicus]|nr:AAA family ATPase [Vibrio diabolicus]